MSAQPAPIITAPTAPGRRFVNRTVDILIEEETGPAITQGMEGDVRIVVLTDRRTGAQIRLDDHMVSFVFEQILPPARRAAEQLQTHYDARGVAFVDRVEILASTAHISADMLTVEARTHGAGSTAASIVTVRLDELGNPRLGTLRLDLPTRNVA